MVTLLLVANLFAELPPSSSIDCQPLPAQLRVRLTLSAMVSPSSATAIRQTVEQVWTPVGLRFEWVSEPAADFWIAVIHGMTNVTEHSPLGMIQFDAGKPQSMARIFLEASRDWAQRYQERRLHTTLGPLLRATVEDPEVVGRVMGYAAAHEHGHFMLRSASHASTGIMRAYRNSTVPFDPGSWRLDGKNRARLLQRMSEDCRRRASAQDDTR
ncbi:MAG TPA: hypothetical protein VF491_21235 [Vicinamibacterales bacterium]